METSIYKIAILTRTYRAATNTTKAIIHVPSSSTLSCSKLLSRISSNNNFLGPSPPIMKCASGYLAQIEGMIFTIKSIPFRYTRRLSMTILIVSFGKRLYTLEFIQRYGYNTVKHTKKTSGIYLVGSGMNLVASTAFGIILTCIGCNNALRRDIMTSRIRMYEK